MKAWLKLFLSAMILSGLIHSADDELAGDKEVIQRPEAKPTAIEPDAGGPVTLSRSAASGQQPSFELPEFVIMGGGERKAVSQRPELSTWMDTSGGIKASPSEAEASKSQVAAQAQRQTLDATTETARPAYGQAQLLYGLANTLETDAFFGQELGQFYYLVQGNYDFSNGGPADIPVHNINQSSQDGLMAHGGWRDEDGSQLSMELDGHWRDRLLTLSALPAPNMSRSLYQANLNWDGSPNAAFREHFQIDGDQAQVILPGLGSAYEEGFINVQADLEKELLTNESRTLLIGHFYAGQLDQDQGDRSSILAGGWFMARIDVWSGAKLSLGISLDSISGGVQGFLVAPRAEFEQRLGCGLGVWVRFAPKLELPTLEGGLFDMDPALPGTRTLPSEDSVNLEAGLSAALPQQVELELKALIRQDDNASFLDDAAGQGLWTETNVRGEQRVGAELGERAPLGGDFSERLSVKWLTVSLSDSPGLVATFAPALEGEAWLDWHHDVWTASLGAVSSAARQGRLEGGDTLPAYTDLRLKGSYAVTDWLNLIAEARNLLSQEVEEFSGYADPAPFVGAGLQAKF